MHCELCSTVGEGGGTTRCQRCGFDTTLPPDIKQFLISLTGFRPGELLDGRYRIDRILGYGGMSVVYKAHDEVLGEEVAIKVINRGRFGDDNKLVTDIKRDIVTTRKLAHPDIVKIYDFHKGETCGYLTMEFVPGKDVASLITERGRLGEGEVCRIAEQVAEALHYAHTNGVVHCDIKPANLLLSENGRVKIADFGISRVMHEESSGLTGLVVGTPAYMAPEQIRGERPGPRTDMYALGVVMWHCLMGSPPYTRGDISYQHVHEPLPPLVDVSPDVERIVRRAASKAMDDRYPSMAVMAQELHEILRKMAMVVEATIVQAPQTWQAATLLQPASAPAAAKVVVQDLPAEQAGTVAQAPPPAPAATQAMSPPPVPAGASGRVPPVSVGPAGGSGMSPSSPPAASKMWIAAIAAGFMLLAGAAAWGLFFRSPEAVKPGQPQLAAVGGLQPPQVPPVAVTASPSPEPRSPGASPVATPRKAAVGAGAAAGAAGALTVASLSPSVAPPQDPAATPSGSAELQPVSPPQNRAPEPVPVSAAVAPSAGAHAVTVSQPPAPAPVAATKPGVEAGSVPLVRTLPPEPGPSTRPAAPEPEQARPDPTPAARLLDLTPIRLTSLPRGRWCDVQVRAVGTGLPMPTARSEAERRLTGERSAELDAYRRIAENVKGLQVSGGSTVKDFVTSDASYKTKTDAVIRGARRVDSQKNADGSWSVVMELNLAGMCDVIQGGTP